jgi:hypothetical protein
MVNSTSESPTYLWLSQRDLAFLVNTASPEVRDKARLAQIIQGDADFRKKYVSDEKVFRAVIDDDEALLKISPKRFCSTFMIISKRPKNR